MTGYLSPLCIKKAIFYVNNMPIKLEKKRKTYKKSYRPLEY